MLLRQEVSKAAPREATDKLSAAAVDVSAELKDFAQAGYKSLLACREQARKTLDEHRNLSRRCAHR